VVMEGVNPTLVPKGETAASRQPRARRERSA
jgi:hypothetical protein